MQHIDVERLATLEPLWLEIAKMNQEILVAGASMSFLPSNRLLTGYAWDGLTAAASIHPLGQVESTLLLGL